MTGGPFGCGASTVTISSSNLPGLVRGDRAPVRLERERVLVLARDAVALGDVLGRLAHRLGRVALRHPRVDEPPADRRVDQLARRRAGSARSGFSITNGDAGHRLDAAGEHDVAVAGLDRARGLRTASRPDAHRRLTVTPGTSTGSPASSAPIRATLRLSSPAPFVQPKIDVLDRRAVDPVALDRGRDHARREVVGPHGRQLAAVAADRRAQRVDYPGVASLAQIVDSCGGVARRHVALAAPRCRLPRDRQVVSRHGRGACSTGSRRAPTRTRSGSRSRTSTRCSRPRTSAAAAPGGRS